MEKCSWANGEPIESYHDNEHGKMPKDNSLLFEMLTLEIFQPGLSFNIVLKKRSGLRKFFKDYNLKDISLMTEADILLGLANDEIIKHRLKIESVIHNAKLLIDNGINLRNYLFDTIDYRFGTGQVGPLLSKQMKKDGFKFVGPSVTTSLLEAIGLLEGHFDYCELHNQPANFSYQTKFGALHIEYDNFLIKSSSLIHNSIAAAYAPSNSFEQYLIYHLDNYLEHNIYNFKLLLDTTKATKFQQVVWDAIKAVPFGETRTYGDIAFTIGSGAFRAVGAAAAKSNFALFIPAHRIVSSKAIGGFQNQVELKREMLEHEGITTYS